MVGTYESRFLDDHCGQFHDKRSQFGFMLEFLQNDPPTGSWQATTFGQGVATMPWTYPNDGVAHTFRVRVVGWGRPEAPAQLASQPITLTVGGNTAMALSVSREQSSSSHTVLGRLTSGATAVPYRTIKFKVNEEPYTSSTGPDGRFSLTVNLPPADNQPTTYQISAVSEGDQNKNKATACATKPNGSVFGSTTEAT